MIGELTLAVESDMDLDDIMRTVHTHPTLSEAVAEAAADARGAGLHSH
jgi:dihydrolipoamide dehydrogenase